MRLHLAALRDVVLITATSLHLVVDDLHEWLTRTLHARDH